MFDPSQYELLDFGGGRKLEQFGRVTLDRPSPAAERAERKLASDRWSAADARFERTSGDKGCWHLRAEWPEPWTIEHDAARFDLKPTEFGHVGLFPEQAENWDWLARQTRTAGRPLKVLNLFAYTGGSTLAAAAAGAAVVHVDAARNTVGWARENARASDLAEAPIRWIVDDAARFVRREIRRGHAYDAVILDPPSYGHGPSGEVWKLSEHLLPLLRDCAVLLGTQRRAKSTSRRLRNVDSQSPSDEREAAAAFVLLTCHSPGFGPAELGACLSDALFGSCGPRVEARRLKLRTADGRSLDAGVVVRWSAVA